jgi:putative Mg2+ transporter-C (MgtC) family protein
MLQYPLRLLLAFAVGLVVGIFSVKEDQTKSSRDFVLICLGGALLSIIAVGIFQSMDIPWVGDPTRIPAQVISALGFLGAGMIWINKDNQVEGITEAASLWLTAILGMIIGAGLNELSLLGVFFIILIYWLSPRMQGHIKNIRRYILKYRGKKPS